MKNINYILLILAITSLSSCKENKSTIKIGYLPIAECLPLYVATEKGYFEEQGLNVELIPQSGGPNIFRELNSDNIDIGFSNVVTLIKQNSADNIKYQSIFGASLEAEYFVNHAIFKLKTSTSVKEIKYGVNARYNIEELMLRHYLLENGIRLNDSITKNFIAIPFPKMLSQLKDKEVDNICLVEPFLTMAKLDTTFAYVGNHYPIDTKKEILVATYVSKTKFIDANNSVISKFNIAMSKAINDINKNENKTRDYLLQYTRISPDILNSISLSKFSKKVNETDLQYIINLIKNNEINYDNNFFDNKVSLPNAEKLIYEQ
jgi:NitT/TauT family transport system substrate-binding protein